MQTNSFKIAFKFTFITNEFFRALTKNIAETKQYYQVGVKLN